MWDPEDKTRMPSGRPIGPFGRKSRELGRMTQWLLLSVSAYMVATILAGIPGDADAGLYPRIQIILWKCGHLNLAAFIGYWIGRTRLGRLHQSSTDMDRLAHAIVIGMTMLAFGMAL